MTPLISVIILNWNGRRFLGPCLDSLTAQRLRDFEVILVDNGSADGSADFVSRCYPWVKLAALPENIGFAAGNNHGLKLCCGEFIVTLNNDTVVEPDFLQALVEPVRDNKGIGAVAAKMLNYYDRHRIDAFGLVIAKNGLGYNNGVGQMDGSRFDQVVPVFGPCGGAALYRRQMLDEIGFYDNDFFAYYEDFDLAWRCRMAGWGCVAMPGAVAYHVHSATSGEWSAFKVYQTHRNKWQVIGKNWPASVLMRYLPTVLCYDLAALLLSLLRGRGSAALKARLDVIRGMSNLLRKRKMVLAKQKLSDSEVMQLFSPSESPFATFIRKIKKR